MHKEKLHIAVLSYIYLIRKLYFLLVHSSIVGIATVSAFEGNSSAARQVLLYLENGESSLFLTVLNNKLQKQFTYF